MKKNTKNINPKIESYSHIFDFCFLVTCKDSNPKNISAKKIRSALLERVNMLDDNELLEACGILETTKD